MDDSSTRPGMLRDLDALAASLPLPELGGMRIFATGCTGFFGFWILSAIDSLNRLGQAIEVVALTRYPQRFLDRHPAFRDRPWLSLVQGDIAGFSMPPGRFDAFIHGATDTSPDAAARPAALLASMIDGTRRVLDGIAASGAGRILLVSSGAVYGNQPALQPALHEDDLVAGDSLDPTNAYGEGKRVMEMLCTCAGGEGLPLPVVARCFAFVGPHLPAHLAPAQLLHDALGGGPLILHGDGSPLRSYLYSADLAFWLLTLLARGIGGRAYNVGGTGAISLAELARTIRDVVAPDAEIEIRGEPGTSPRHRYIPDTTRARQELGLAEWTPLAHAISRMAACMRGNTA